MLYNLRFFHVYLQKFNMSDNIKVGIRVRPLIPREKETNAPILWSVTEDCIQQVSASDKFHFDRVFNTEEDNSIVYYDLCKPIVESVMLGFNGTIFAYGQTSSGKTYTMMGEHNIRMKGIFHHTIKDVFDIIQVMRDRKFHLRVSFIEIYNERVYDLLSSKNENLKIFEDGFGVVKVKDVEEEIVNSREKIEDLMKLGLKKRRTGETQMNRASSRSHSIFRMIIESTSSDGDAAAVNVSQLNLVDLAGSENVKQTKTKGDRFKEGIHINLSLSTLSQVIGQLSEKQDQFIKYRDSKLTRLLQNSLGGNALTAIICTVTPTSLRETLSTINFASRAKKIKNKPEKNEIMTDQAMAKQYANEIKKLTQKLKASKEQGKELEEKSNEIEILKRKIAALEANFVHFAPEPKNKVARRETWCGNFRLLKSAVFRPSESSVALPDLPTVEEEKEVDADSTELDLFPNFRGRKSSSALPKRTRCSGISKKDSATQTDCDIDDNLIKAYDEAMIMVSELRCQLTTLQDEYTQLTEYTTLEKQCLKAASEHLEELKALKKENDTLKNEVTFLSRKQAMSLSISFKTCDKEAKTKEKHVSNCEDSKLDLQETSSLIHSKLNKAICLESSSSVDNSTLLNENSGVNLSESTPICQNSYSFNSELNKAVFLENSSVIESSKLSNKRNANSCSITLNKAGCLENSSLSDNSKLSNEKSRVDLMESMLMDETAKSHFLAFYDEYVESESERLKEEIEALKRDSEWKDKQIDLLKEKVKELKEKNARAETEFAEVKLLKEENKAVKYDNDLKNKQIGSLRDEMEELGKLKRKAESELIEVKKLRKENETVKYDNDFKAEQITLLKAEINELTEVKSKTESKFMELKKLKTEIQAVKLDNDFKDKQIGLLKDKLEIKEQMISSLKDEITLYTTSTCDTNDKMDTSAQTSIIEYEFQTPHKDLSFKECQTSPFEISQNKLGHVSSKISTFSIECQTSPKISIFNQQGIVKSPEAVKTSNFDSDDESETRISPLSMYLLNTEVFDKNKQVGKNWKDTQTTPSRFRGFYTQCYDNVPTDNKFIQTSPIANSGRIQPCDCKTKKTDSPEKFKRNIECASHKATVLPQNQSDELKILTKKVSDLRGYTFEILKSCLEPVFMEDVEAPAAFSSESSSGVAEQEIIAIKELIMRLEYYIKNIKENSQLLNEQLESKFEEVASLGWKLKESESNLSAKETVMANMSEKISKLKDSISELSFVCSMLKNVDSQSELVKMRKSASGVTEVRHKINKSGFPIHNLTSMQDMVLKLDCHMEENALMIIDLREKLKKVEKELTTLQKEKSFRPTRSTQTDSISSAVCIDNRTCEAENVNLMSQLEEEIMQLKEKRCELLRCNRELKDAQFEYSAEIQTLKADHEIAKSEWEIKTRKLVKDLEVKYDELLADQEDKLEELKEQHIREMGQKEIEIKNSLVEMKSLHNKELLDVKKKVVEVSDKYSKICDEKLRLRSELEDKNGSEIRTLKRKHVEEISYWKKKWMGTRDLCFNTELKCRQYQDEVTELEKEIQKLKENGNSESLKEKIGISNERDIIQKKYALAKQHISELKQEIANLNRQDVVQNQDNGNIRNTEEFKKLVNELDQKKAKVMTLETNNASLVRELKKFQEMLSSKANVCQCKTSTIGSKSSVSTSCDSSNMLKNKSDPKMDPESVQDRRTARKIIKEESYDHNVCDSKEVDQEKILCTGGGSGPANMMKCYWLEGTIYEKDKEIAELRKQLAEALSKIKALNSRPVISPEKKKKSVEKQHISSFSDDETSNDLTVANAAFHPYHQGAIPKVQPKQILKERNRMISGKPYDWLQSERIEKKKIINEKHKVENPVVNPEEKTENIAEPLNDVEGAKMIAGQATQCQTQ